MTNIHRADELLSLFTSHIQFSKVVSFHIVCGMYSCAECVFFKQKSRNLISLSATSFALFD